MKRATMSRQKNRLKHAKTHNSAADRSASLTFSDHIRELRRRAVWVGLVFFIASSLSYNYHDLLVRIVMAPLDGQKLIYLTPGGGFSFIFQITLYAGLIAAAPMLMYQLYGFVRPTLPLHAQRGAVKVALSATLLMILGVTYGYFIAIPAALKFLANFAGTEILPSLTAESYLSFFLAYVGGLALLFQLPLLLIFWHWIRPTTPSGLLKSERWIIVFAFVAAALITPTPDVINQLMIAGPIIGLYQAGVLIVLSSIARERRRAKRVIKTSKVAQQLTEAPVVVPIPSPVLSPQPTQAFQPRVRTSIDGIRPVSVHHAIQKRTERPLAVPDRRTFPGERPILQRRPRLSVDGISPA